MPSARKSSAVSKPRNLPTVLDRKPRVSDYLIHTTELDRKMTYALRKIYDRDGQAAFEKASSNLLVGIAGLIGHVSGPQRLRHQLDAIAFINRLRG